MIAFRVTYSDLAGEVLNMSSESMGLKLGEVRKADNTKNSRRNPSGFRNLHQFPS